MSATTSPEPRGSIACAARSRRECVVLVAAMLAGCAVRPEIGSDSLSQWEGRRRRLAVLGAYSFAGRLAFRSSREALNARVQWRQDGEEYRIRLGGMLGEAAVELRGGAAGVELRGRDGVHRADSPEELLREHTGWSFPLRGLRYWVLGISTPGAALEALELDRQGRPAHLVQSGWRVVYRRYTSVHDFSLPERLDFDRARLEARLVVGRWTVET